MKAKVTLIWLIALLLGVCIGGISYAYSLLGAGWPGATATFYANGYSGSNATFNSAFVEALNNWNGLSNFVYNNINGSRDPCGAPNSTRGWQFAATNCGTAFGATTLAVCNTWATSWTNGDIVDADIVFNNAWTWDVHSGAGANIDFRRVATHEQGHGLGLGHDNTYAALMNTTYSDSIETPQTDDINGLIAIYSGTPGKATLISPNGTITDNTPTYTWNAVSAATWYYLWVNGPSGNVIKQWYEASGICSGGTCSVTPGTTLAQGDHTWWIQTYNSNGYGPWSDPMDFTMDFIVDTQKNCMPWLMLLLDD